jgi:predicted Zn-dependent protease
MTDAFAFSAWTDARDAAHIARKSGDTAQAITILRGLAKAFPTKEGILASADGLRACGEWNQAVRVLEEAMARMPTSTALAIALADTYAEKKYFTNAIASVRAYLDRVPQDGALWMNLGGLHAAAAEWRTRNVHFPTR